MAGPGAQLRTGSGKGREAAFVAKGCLCPHNSIPQHPLGKSNSGNKLRKKIRRLLLAPSL